MRYKVIANLTTPKIFEGSIGGISLFEDATFGVSPTPKLSISGGNVCEMSYEHTEDITIKSPYFACVEFECDSDDAAETVAKEKLDITLDRLSFLIKEYWIEYRIVKIEKWIRGKWFQSFSPYSNAMKYPAGSNPVMLSKEEKERLEGLTRSEDEIFKKSLYYLAKAEKRLNRDLVRGEDRINEEVFLNFFKPIELISNHISYKKKKNSYWKLLLRIPIDALVSRSAEEAIKKLIGKYNTYNQLSLPTKIREAAKDLGLKDEYADNAIKFNQFRSRLDIAHAHKKISTEKVDYSLLSVTAHSFIEGYLKKDVVLTK